MKHLCFHLDFLWIKIFLPVPYFVFFVATFISLPSRFKINTLSHLKPPAWKKKNTDYFKSNYRIWGFKNICVCEPPTIFDLAAPLHPKKNKLFLRSLNAFQSFLSYIVHDIIRMLWLSWSFIFLHCTLFAHTRTMNKGENQWRRSQVPTGINSLEDFSEVNKNKIVLYINIFN